MYVAFIDFKKDVVSLAICIIRFNIWKILFNCGIPPKALYLITTDDGLECKVLAACKTYRKNSF